MSRMLAEATVPFASVDTINDTLAHGLAFIMVLVAAHPLGLFFPRYFKLPLITGYLITGILAGPFIANLLTNSLVNMLSPTINAMALSFISFQAGQEIYLPELRPQIKGILQLLLILYSVTMVILTLSITFFNDPFFHDKFDMSCQLAVGLMFGSIAVLGSPATIMAIKIELNSVGPFTNLMLGATMTAEFIVLVSFSVSRIFSSIYCAKLDISVANLFFTMGVVVSNLVVGACIGVLIIAIFCIPGGPDDKDGHAAAVEMQTMRPVKGEVDLEAHAVDPDNAPHPHNAYIEETDEYDVSRKNAFQPMSVFGSLYFKAFLWLFMGFLFYIGTNTISEATIAEYGHSWDVKFEPLLVLMVASCLAGHYSTIRHDMHVILDTAAPYIFLPFFVMTGAALKLDEVVDALPLMSLYVILRYVSIFLACYCGGRFVLKLTPQQYNNLWLTMTPQAGVALGLANEVKGLSSDPWAAEFAATIVSAVVVNQIIGPVLCAIGLKHAGESQYERLATLQPNSDDPEATVRGTLGSNGGLGERVDSVVVTAGNGDPRPLLPFYKVRNAVVIGEDEIAFEVALELSLYGAHVNVPLLDEELADKWQKMNEAILARSAKGELISYKNKLKERKKDDESDDLKGLVASTDVLIFTGEPSRALEHVKAMTSLLGTNRPRMIAVIPDPTYCQQLKQLGVLTIQPSIALANIVTRMALLEKNLAESLSAEISTTSNFQTAAYFMRHDYEREGSVHSLSEMKLQGRRLALGRSVVNHHSVDYDRLAEALIAENLPLPPPPSRVSMFGTSAVGHDPFAKRGANMSAYEHFVVEDDVLSAVGTGEVFDEQFVVNGSPRSSYGGSQGGGRSRSSRFSRRRSRLGSDTSSGGGYVRLRRGNSVGNM
uniref:Cation/H+ exchanger domain-containing protein n=1 Tax=Globisporangium ultimum (strain ATCC 200006 / CBS 805.95 / DAOM BR144) TaxID=431595 RepID=K3WXS6_GLOUD